MINAAAITLTATPQPLSDFAILKNAIRGIKGVQLQATGGTLNYGNNAIQPFTLASGQTSDVLPVASLRDLYVRGSGANVIVFL